MGGTEACRETQVGQQVVNMANALEALDAEVSSMCSAMVPVVRCELELDDDPNAEVAMKELVPMANQLREYTERVEKATRRLLKLRNLLEI